MTASKERIHRDVPVILVAILMLFIVALCLLIRFRGPLMIDPAPVTVDYRSCFVISDKEEMLSMEEQQRLHKAMESFQEETGGMPAVWISTYDQWSKYSDLASYAEQSYEYLFQDGKHLLIVCAEPRAWEDTGDWHVELAVGNELRQIMTYHQAEELKEAIQSALKGGIGAAIADNLEAMAPQLMTRRLDSVALSDIVLGVMFFGTAITATGTALVDTVRKVRMQKNWHLEKADYDSMRRRQKK